MKIILKHLLIQLVLLSSSIFYAQVGIGTTTPDTSSILDISSTSKGLLMPRLTTSQRDGIVSPAEGLMIYNTSLSNGQLNIGTPSVPKWIGIKEKEQPTISAVVLGDTISITSTNALLVSGMTMLAQTGTYLVSFNAQHETDGINQPFSSAQGIIDVDMIYQDLMAFPGGISHTVIFGDNEVLSPGVYDVTGAGSISGTLTLDGGTDVNPVFIIRCTGAFSTGANTTVILAGNAEAKNIFWVSEAAMSMGANSIMKGILVSRAGAITLGAGTSLVGRMFTKSGALSVGANSILAAPSGVSPINLRSLSSFVMFTSSGAVTSDATSTIIGDVGTAAGALTIAGALYGQQYPAGTTSSSVTTATYSIYQNGTELANSSRTINLQDSAVSLQTMVTIPTAEEAIEVWWKVDTGEARLNNRILSLIRFGD